MGTSDGELMACSNHTVVDRATTNAPSVVDSESFNVYTESKQHNKKENVYLSKWRMRAQQSDVGALVAEIVADYRHFGLALSLLDVPPPPPNVGNNLRSI